MYTNDFFFNRSGEFSTIAFKFLYPFLHRFALRHVFLEQINCYLVPFLAINTPQYQPLALMTNVFFLTMVVFLGWRITGANQLQRGKKNSIGMDKPFFSFVKHF